MKAHLASGVVAIIFDAARAAVPEEACGLLFGRIDNEGWTIDAASVAENVASAPRRRFEVDPRHLIEVQKAARAGGPRAVGVWHSHPDGSPTPSAADRQGVSDLDWLWLIAAGGQLAAWAPERDGGFRAIPLLDGAAPVR